MASLEAGERARLPDNSFAYIDSRGRRLLPIHDEPHVRNALARFDRVTFEDETARSRARVRLLKAARKHGIVPVGFVAGQLEPQRKLPTGAITFLLSDIEGSTELLTKLGDRYAGVLNDVRRLLRAEVRRAGGHEVDARADEFFAAFRQASSAVTAAVAAQRAMATRAWPDDITVRVRMGLHSGRPTLTPTGYVGLSVHAAARICRVAQGGQIVLSGAVVTALGEPLGEEMDLRSLGEHRLRGLPHAIELLALGEHGRAKGVEPPTPI